ncbi:hypothetical protein [Flavobacterium sp. C4GT6]|uniref:hypothetical protein n=1 Tax=Flavobacterium sp. C4GT6 TaxID=3103818 RepID=UPI002ED55612
MRELFFIVIAIVLYKSIFKRDDIYTKSINFLRWIIVCYSVMGLLSYLLLLVFPNEDYALINRATGTYWWSYLLMSTGHLLIPLLLLNKKLGRSIYFLLFLGIMMNIGRLFERFVILTTSLHRDYLPQAWETTENSLIGMFLIIAGNFIFSLFTGLLVATFIVLVFYVIHLYKNRKPTVI